MIKFEASATTFLRGYGDISKLEGMATYRVGGASLCAQGITTWQTTQQLALCFVLWCHVDLGGVSRTFRKPEAQTKSNVPRTGAYRLLLSSRVAC